MISRYEILTGEHKGKIVDAVGCNARPYPDCPESEIDWKTWGDGIWIPSLNLRMKQTINQATGQTGCGNYVDYKNLVIAFDKYNKEIFVGDTLYISTKNSVAMVTVKKFGAPYHVGCGWMQRKMTVVDVDTNKTLTVNSPSSTIKVIK